MPVARGRAGRGLRALFVVGCVAVAGCATIPSSGTVHIGRTLGEPTPPTAPLIANRPTTGEPPAAIVQGFLSALASPGDAGIVRSYLTSSAQSRWHPSTAVTVYDDRHEHLENPARGRWVLHTRRVAVISPTGRRTLAPRALQLRFRLVRAGGQWRIAAPPDRIVLAESDLGESYQVYRLSFLGAATGRAVSVAVVLPSEQPGLANALVRSLLAGPPRDLAGAVVTAAPPQTATIGNVTVVRHTADVNLSSAARGLSGEPLRRFGAQLLLTLQQVPGVQEVRLLVDRAPLATVSSAGQLRTAVAPPGSLVLVRPSGTVTDLRTSSVAAGEPVPAARSLLGRRWPSVSAALLRGDGAVVAAARAHGAQRLVVGMPGRAPRVVAHAGSVEPVQASQTSALFVLDQRRLVAVTGHGVHPVALPSRLSRQGVLAAALAPDGVRLAVIVGPIGKPRLFVGALRPDRRAVGLHRVIALDDPQGLGWSAPEEITTTELRGGVRTITTLDPAGFAARRSALPSGLRSMDQLCAAPLAPLVVVGDGLAWWREDGSWVRLGRARSCGYSG